jgi:carbonic anhydrase
MEIAVTDRNRPIRTRRQMIRSLAAGVAAAAAAPAVFEVVAGAAQVPKTPEAALKALIDGNKRFAANQLTSIQHDLEVLKRRTADKQEPFAAVLTCADSRIPVELIFDQTIGHIFVTRVAGNVVTPEIIASLEYAVAVLRVKTVLVLGHSNCGAVKAAMNADTVPGQISTLYLSLRQAVEQSKGDFVRAIGANSQVQAGLLRTTSTVIRDALQAKTITVSSGVYDLATGVVTLT